VAILKAGLIFTVKTRGYSLSQENTPARIELTMIVINLVTAKAAAKLELLFNKLYCLLALLINIVQDIRNCQGQTF
jgi:hypothetical protein